MTDGRVVAAVERQGRTAGQTFRSTGAPSRNPYRAKTAELAAAWRRGYLAEATPKKVTRGR